MGGDPQSKLWFIGIEESDPWTMADLVHYRKNEISIGCYQEKPDVRKGVAAYCAKIAQPLSKSYGTSCWHEYRDKMLWRKGCGILNMNFYPICRPRIADWPPECTEMFGYGPENWDKYQKKVEERRFPRILEMKQKNKPRAVICFGKAIGWPAARKTFELDVEPIPLDEGKILVHKEPYNVILTPHFSRGMSDERAELIAAELGEWGVQLP